MREQKIMVRLSAAEKSSVEGAAGALSIPAASWARMVLLRAVREHAPQPYQTSSRALPHEQRPELLSLFCGAGGLDQGFKDAGFRSALAIDIDPDCVNTFRQNHPDSQAVVADVTQLDIAELDALYGSDFRPVGVIGGPPCQSFSVSNVYQREDDPRHGLPEAYARVLRKLNERSPISFFLFENVPGLLGKKHVHRYMKFKELFEDAGFLIYEAVLNALDYGVPQERKRVFIIGLNSARHGARVWTPPEPEKDRKSVRDTIGDLPEPIENGRGLDPASFPVHPNHWCLVPRSTKFRTGNLTEGQMFGRSFRTLVWDRPSWTVAYGHREVHVHPNGRRRLSMYEAMLLQTFPRSYVLTGNMSSQIVQVSEAVPVRLAWRVAISIRNCLGL